MKPLLALALLLLPVAAFAASPEDDYIAARDKFIAQFKLKEDEQVTDAIAKAEVAARADLEKKMQALIGASGIKGVPEPGKLNLESLIMGDMGFGMLEGLKYDLKGGTELLVTTRSFVERWLKAEQEIWKDRPGYAFGTELGPALRSAELLHAGDGQRRRGGALCGRARAGGSRRDADRAPAGHRAGRAERVDRRGAARRAPVHLERAGDREDHDDRAVQGDLGRGDAKEEGSLREKRGWSGHPGQDRGRRR